MKPFCETDNQLICHICRDEREHRGHTFRPLKEAQEDLRGKLTSVIVCSYMQEIDGVSKINEQQLVLSDKKQRCDEVKRKLQAQFEETITKLRKKEEEAMREIDEEPARMAVRLTELERYLATVRDRNNTLQSGLEITDHREFLTWWREKGSALCDTQWRLVNRGR